MKIRIKAIVILSVLLLPVICFAGGEVPVTEPDNTISEIESIDALDNVLEQAETDGEVLGVEDYKEIIATQREKYIKMSILTFLAALFVVGVGYYLKDKYMASRTDLEDDLEDDIQNS